MRKSKKRSGLLVAVESGAAWPVPALTERPGVVRRVVSQNDGETPEAFASRFGGLVDRLFPADVEFRNAVVTCNERTDAVALVARRAMGWNGRRAAWLSALGFAIVLLNFVLVSYFVTTSHTFQ